ETLRRIRKGRFVVRFQLDWSSESAATTTTFGPIGPAGTRRCGLRRGCFSSLLGGGFRRAEVSDLASELDLVARNFAGVNNPNVIVLDFQRLNKRHRVAL